MMVLNVFSGDADKEHAVSGVRVRSSWRNIWFVLFSYLLSLPLLAGDSVSVLVLFVSVC